MRHRKKVNHLGRKSQHRKAMLSNMAASLILHKRIYTTLAKAKALKIYLEPLITKSKDDSTHSRRVVFSYLGNKYAVSELFREVSQKIADRPGGYTRILKTGFRQGDGAEMCMIELVDYNVNLTSKAAADQGKKTRRAGRRAKSDVAAAATFAAKEVKEETKVEEVATQEVTVEEIPIDEVAPEEPAVEKSGPSKATTEVEEIKEPEVEKEEVTVDEPAESVVDNASESESGTAEEDASEEGKK